MLAYLASSKADFDLIWSFTRTEFLLRDDGLAVWKWDPNSTPHVTDSNNASDGDILIAYALLLAGSGWDRQDLTATAKTMIADNWQIQRDPPSGEADPASRRHGVFRRLSAMMGPVINLSYWIFEAFPNFAAIDSSDRLEPAWQGWLSLIESRYRATLSPGGLDVDEEQS